jgi:hypothetical protein
MSTDPNDMNATDPWDFDPSATPQETDDDSKPWLGVGVHEPVQVVAHELAQNQSGSNRIEITFEDAKGRRHTERYNMVATVLWRLQQLFTACDYTSKIRFSQPGMVRSAIYGKPLRLTIRHGKPNAQGKTYREVGKVEKSTRPLTHTAAPPQDAPNDGIPFGMLVAAGAGSLLALSAAVTSWI